MEAMKPFLLGQVFSYTFKLLGKDFWRMFFTVIICIAIILIPIAVFIAGFIINPELIISNINRDPLSMMQNPFYFISPSFWIMYGVILIVALLVIPFGHGMILFFSSSRLKGITLSFKQAFFLAARKYGRLLLTAISGFILILPILVIYFAVYFGFMNSTLSGIASGSMENMTRMFSLMPLMFLLNLVYSVAMLLIGIAIHFASCITVNENQYAFLAVLKGFKLLFKGSFWRNIGHYLVMCLVLAGFGIGFMLVMMILSIPIAIATMIAPVMIVLMVLLMLGFAGFVYPFAATFVQLMYFNARLHVDGIMFLTNELEPQKD